MSMTVPFGKEKDKPLEEASEATLKWLAGVMLDKLEQEPSGKFAGGNRKMLEACKAQLAARGVDPNDVAPVRQKAPAKPAAASATLAKATQGEIVIGSFGTPERVNEMLTKAQETSHLVSPATMCTVLPDGFDVVLSLIRVNPDASKEGPRDVANVSGNLALSGNTLKRIAVAAGVSWDPIRSGRLDNGKNPLYCHYRAVGWARNFDNSPRCLMDEVEIDLRPGSPQLQAMRDRAGDNNVDSQIRDMGLFILRHTITKAKLRAITDLGVKRSYTKKELERDFQVARLMWTGRSEDPEVRRIFAAKTAEAALSSMHTMFGAPPAREAVAPLPALPVRMNAFAAPQGHDAPPVGAVRDDEPPPDIAELYGDDDFPT